MPNSTDLDILILAGGKSRRMGQDKALLTYQGQPLLTTVSRVALSLSPRVFVLSPWPQKYLGILPSGVQSLTEAMPNQGPLSALTQALHILKGNWVLLLACDMPQLEAKRISKWRSQLVDLPPDCLAYVPQLEPNSWEPLCGFYRRESLDSLESYLAQGGRSFQTWLSRINAIAIPISQANQTMFHNCNRPEDLDFPPSAKLRGS